MVVVVRRGSYVESTHAFSACVATASGDVPYVQGDVDRAYPIRSLAKPFLAAEVVRSGAAEAYRLNEMEVALAAGSHDGEQRHVAAVRTFLSKVGVSEECLLCGVAMEGRLTVGPPVANNCSGKHAAVLAMCRHLSYGVDGYTRPDHPVQRRLLPKLLETFQRTSTDAAIVIDGCGMPIFGASLRQIAIAYARFGVDSDVGASRVRDSMAAEPGYAGGWFDNLDTRIMTWSNGAIIAKVGAEGLHGDSFVARGIGIAVKIHDGNSRALPPVLARLFAEFAPEIPIGIEHLDELSVPAVRNASGQYVGNIGITQCSAGEYSNVL